VISNGKSIVGGTYAPQTHHLNKTLVLLLNDDLSLIQQVNREDLKNSNRR